MLSIEGMETCNSVQIDKFWGHNFHTDRYYLACDVASKILHLIWIVQVFLALLIPYHALTFVLWLRLSPFCHSNSTASQVAIWLTCLQLYSETFTISVFTAHSADYDYMLIPAALLRSDNSSGNDKTGHCSHYGQARADTESPGHKTLVGLLFVRPLSALCCEIRSSVRTPQRPAVSWSSVTLPHTAGQNTVTTSSPYLHLPSSIITFRNQRLDLNAPTFLLDLFIGLQ